MISPSISRTLLGIGRVKTRSNFGRIYSNHPHIRIQIKVISSINQAKFCTGKNFHLRVQISQQNKKEKEWRKTRKDLYNVVVVERNTSL
jgi:Holliday junction resolvase RusA-like endonuclease